MNGYNAGAGYDLATGLGSVDANALATNWASITDFTLTASTPPSVASGGSVAVSIAFSSPGSSASLSLSCSGLPPETSYSFSPGQPTIASGATLTISTTAPQTASLHHGQPPRPGSWRASTILMFGGVLIFAGIHGRRRYCYAALVLLLAGFLIASVGCGGGGSGNTSQANAINTGTPAGIYTVTVTASSGAILRNTTFTLTVN